MKKKKSSTHSTAAQLHSCEGGRGPMRLMRHRGSREGSIVRGLYRRLSRALSPFTLCGAMAVRMQWGFTPDQQARRMSMQGRAGKAPKREMVIESPQQYKCLAEIEAEVEAGSQVAAVSDAETTFFLKPESKKMLSEVFISGFPFQEQLWREVKKGLKGNRKELLQDTHLQGAACWYFVGEAEHLWQLIINCCCAGLPESVWQQRWNHLCNEDDSDFQNNTVCIIFFSLSQ